MSEGSKWSDLGPRVGSAIVMVLIGGLAIWQGGWLFAALAVLIIAAMHWELVRMLSRDALRPLVAAGVAGLSLALVLAGVVPIAPAFMASTIIVAVTAGRSPFTAGAFSAAYWLSGYGLVTMRADGLWLLVFLIGLVVATDIMGYFAGRIIGGPKFWPKVSPKKTWSGVVAGWLGAAVVAVVMAGQGVLDGLGLPDGAAVVALLAVGLSFASQMGDIAESALKRRVGVKDSSALIPGHGGFMDRFDAVIGATLVVTLYLLLSGA